MISFMHLSDLTLHQIVAILRGIFGERKYHIDSGRWELRTQIKELRIFFLGRG